MLALIIKRDADESVNSPFQQALGPHWAVLIGDELWPGSSRDGNEQRGNCSSGEGMSAAQVPDEGF